MTEATIPELEGWLTITEAADMLGISRQHSWRMAVASPPKWKTVHKIGTSGVYVVQRSEVEERMARRG